MGKAKTYNWLGDSAKQLQRRKARKEAEKFVLKDIHGKVCALAWANSRRGPS